MRQERSEEGEVRGLPLSLKQTKSAENFFEDYICQKCLQNVLKTELFITHYSEWTVSSSAVQHVPLCLCSLLAATSQFSEFGECVRFLFTSCEGS